MLEINPLETWTLCAVPSKFSPIETSCDTTYCASFS